jgi:predicted lipoprotein with Yx(FWY)xxD motif
MRHALFVRAAIITALAVGGLTACAGGEPSSSARVAVTSALPKSAGATAPPAASAPPASSATGAPAAPAAAPKPAAVPPASSSAAPPPIAGSSTSDTGTERLALATHPKLGKIVTDDAGMTVYRLDSDPAKATKSSCVDDCAKVFPPVTLPADGTVDVAGIDPKLVGQLKRPDGTIQLTLAGRPLYRFVGDTAPGDAVGHGLTGASALTATGAKAVARTS